NARIRRLLTASPGVSALAPPRPKSTPPQSPASVPNTPAPPQRTASLLATAKSKDGGTELEQRLLYVLLPFPAPACSISCLRLPPSTYRFRNRTGEKGRARLARSQLNFTYVLPSVKMSCETRHVFYQSTPAPKEGGIFVAAD
uniref:Uncharacterized protein n=1 Tax=Apteryx owenii TaxID=8824 RepID=A0A8B9PG93_APTOW